MRYLCVPTAWGWVALARNENGLLAVIPPRPDEEEALTALRAKLGGGSGQEDRQAFGDLPLRLEAYFAGDEVDLSRGVVLDWSRTGDFRRRVLLAVREIPYGHIRPYRWVATKIGRPQACRAVGQALRANPWPLVIPCHRVVGSAGRLGGYSAGQALKRRLLKLEGGGQGLR
ncbi:MAG: methylated-DNA--[protein]-cysteine S-methyltransferase [Moorellales bacterium]